MNRVDYLTWTILKFKLMYLERFRLVVTLNTPTKAGLGCNYKTDYQLKKQEK